nr:flagellar basal-body MS-ring/collar protein FliF [Pleionea sp. CnH1-48]
MIGIAASVALGVFIVLWGTEEEMTPLALTDAATTVEIVNMLKAQNIPHRLDERGIISIRSEDFQKVQLEISMQGLEINPDRSDSLLNKESGFGVSQRLETARLQRSAELKLARTIEEFRGVRSAKVHLAIPKESAFLKNKRKPSASVLLNLFSRRTLEDEQIRAIVDLVTGSVANLEPEKVTITDQFGRLLHSGSRSKEERETTRELKMQRERQQELQEKIDQILLPILGEGNYTVQVNVDMDFSKTEQTQQLFNPEVPAVRSERTLEDTSNAGRATGIPGALSNQPPAASTIPETLTSDNTNSTEGNGSQNRRLESERNYDLDTTISHTRNQIGVVRKVSVSVGVDFVDSPTDPTQRIPREQAIINNITRLIQGVIGYNVGRGDRVEVESFPFVRPEPIEVAPLQFYEQPLFQALWKPITALLLGLLLIFGVLKPVMRNLTTAPEVIPTAEPEESLDDIDVMADEQLSLTGGGEESLQLPGPSLEGSRKIEQAKAVVAQDPTMVAQLIKSWVDEDE